MNALLSYQKEILEKLKKADKNYRKTPNERIKKPYLETRLCNLEQLWDEFKTGHKSIIGKVTYEDKQDAYFTEDMYEEFEELYVSYKSSLKEALQPYLMTSSTKSPIEAGSGGAHVQHAVRECEVKLPRIQLPTFSGNYVEWQTFYDMFLSLIHNNHNLSAVQKLHYLKSNLSGEPQSLLRNFSTTDSNYDEAWKQLVKRYNNRRYNCNNILKSLFTQKQITCESASAIKHLLDTTTISLHSLRNMGINIDNWDVFIVYLVVSKLDSESIRLWEYQLSIMNDELPSWSQLSNFLESRFRSLEMVDTNETHKQSKNIITKTSKSFHGSVDNRKINSNVTPIKCSVCKGEHYLYHCKEFCKFNVKDRQDYIQKNNLCFNCFSPSHLVMKCRKSVSCRRCGRRHHSLLHFDNEVSSATSSESKTTPSESANNVSTPISTNFSSKRIEASCVLLATVSVWAYNENGYKQPLRGLLDQGSQASFISESVVQLLGLARKSVSGTVSGIGDGGHTSIKHMVSLQVQSRHNPEVKLQVNAYVLRSVTSFLPSTELQTSDWLYLDKIPLADPGYAKPGKIDILFGAEVYSEVLLDGVVRHNKLLAQNTTLGWVLSGMVSDSTSANRRVVNMHLNVSGDELLKKFWEMENEPNCIQKRMSKTEQQCEEFYDRTTTRDENGTFIVKLPFNKEDPECQYGQSILAATRRWYLLEKRLQKNPSLKEDYNKVLQEYIKMNHMIPVNNMDVENPKAVYLPHHAVVRQDKDTTKVRVVFDGSCKGVNNFSLNDNLLVGPKLQQDLRHILMRWRSHKICIVADIVKMYRMVKVNDQDTDYQRIVWRSQPDEPLRHFKLLRLTFGTACAPYLAVKTLQKLADIEHDRFPIAAEITKRDYYMDDLMTGCETLLEAIHIYKDMSKLMNCGGFELQKWSSNNKELLTHIEKDKHQNNDLLRIKTSTIVKVLGLVWHRELDSFQYTLDLPGLNGPISKRQVLSDVARLYDPLGWISPVIIIAKMFMQKLWQSKLGWDELLSTELYDEWVSFRASLEHLRDINIPRWLHTSIGSKVELHAFADASRLAYGAAVYMRIHNGDNISVKLVTAKSKVAPIEKEVSIPRLELCGAVLAAKLLYEVAQVMHVAKENWYAWSDSTIVLAWLRGGSSRWTTFVSNRVSEILNILEYSQWRHVATHMNPADCISRGLPAHDLAKHSLWWSGPSWLSQMDIEVLNPVIEDTHEEERHKCLTVSSDTENHFIWTMFSSLTKTLKAISYWRRVLQNLRLPKEKRIKYSKLISTAEINQSLEICIKQVQKESFSDEMKQLKRQGFVAKGSKLRTLCPILDKNEILRVGGRIDQSAVQYDTKHPIILPGKSHLTKLIINEAHIKTLHGGPQAMLYYIRTKYWILRGKDAVKLHYRSCVKCLRYSKLKNNQLMGQIPEVRLKPTRPFKSSGCDYMGPINVKFSPGRGAKSYKGYVCLFVCMVTRAIHLEVVTDLTAKAFIAAFKRFTARRGHCSDLFSDNGTNFVGASKQLREMFNSAKSTISGEIEALLNLEQTSWHFIPPHAPNFGGLWEAGVRSVKTHLHKVIIDTNLTYEEWSTVLAQVEACLNSRPISSMSDDPNDPQALTPGHFLIGEPLVSIPDTDNSDCNVVGLDRWRLTQKIINNFWKRWYKDYLVNLNQRYKWYTKKAEPEIGDVVILKDDNIPPAKWILGRITNKYLGPDNIARVVSIKCKNGEFKRPISKICVLPK